MILLPLVFPALVNTVSLNVALKCHSYQRRSEECRYFQCRGASQFHPNKRLSFMMSLFQETNRTKVIAIKLFHPLMLAPKYARQFFVQVY